MNKEINEQFLKAIDIKEQYKLFEDNVVNFGDKVLVDYDNFVTIILNKVEDNFTEEEVIEHLRILSLQKEVDAYRAKSKAKMWNNLTEVVNYTQGGEQARWEEVFENVWMSVLVDKEPNTDFVMEI